jgi:integrase
LLDATWRPGAWDAEDRVLLFTRDDPWILSFCCRVSGCDYQPRNKHKAKLCEGHHRLWQEAGKPDVAVWVSTVKSDPVQRLCAVGRGVNSCQRVAAIDGLCDNHARQLRTGPLTKGRLIEEGKPYAAPPPCSVAHCPRRAHSWRWRDLTLCRPHIDKATRYSSSHPDAAMSWWATAVAPMRVGVFAFSGLTERAQNEILFGLQQSQLHERSIHAYDVRAIIEWMRDAHIDSCLAMDADEPPLTRSASDFLVWVQRRLRWRLTSPEQERRKDVWDLMVFDQTDAARARHRTLDFTRIHQDWLREVTKAWAYAKMPTVGTYWPRKVLIDVELLSDAIAAGPSGGHRPGDVGRADVERFFHLVRGRSQEDGTPYSGSTRQAMVHHVRSFLADAATLGLLKGVQPGFSILKGEGVKVAVAQRDVGRRSIPETVIAELDKHLDLLGRHPVRGPASGLGPQLQRLAYELLRDTGRRVGEVGALRCDCIWRDNDGSAWLLYDNVKSARLDRRIPIFESLARSVEQVAADVTALFPDTPRSDTALFPAQVQNRLGRRSISGGTIRIWLRTWIDQIPGLTGQVFDDDGELRSFPDVKVHPHAFRHSYAQRLADSGAPLDVTQKLMDHGSPMTTQGYYEVSRPRLRKAVRAVEKITVDRDGMRERKSSVDPIVTTGIRAVAVPYGLCREPSNVKAGGHDCPIRYQCAGCGHFETNPSYLPELRERLDQLLRSREAGLAMGAAEWALPHQQEIDRYRDMIADMEQQLSRLEADERRTIAEASALLRRTRRTAPVFLGQLTIGGHADAKQ